MEYPLFILIARNARVHLQPSYPYLSGLREPFTHRFPPHWAILLRCSYRHAVLVRVLVRFVLGDGFIIVVHVGFVQLFYQVLLGERVVGLPCQLACYSEYLNDKNMLPNLLFSLDTFFILCLMLRMRQHMIQLLKTKVLFTRVTSDM